MTAKPRTLRHFPPGGGGLSSLFHRGFTREMVRSRQPTRLRHMMRTNLTIFVLFFGIALLDAIRGGNWLRIIFWLVIGALFFLADRREMAKRTP